MHGGTADVDIFDELFGGESGLCRSGFKGIEIDDNEIDRGDAVFRGLLLIFGKVAAVEQAAVNFGMKRVDAAAEHFRPASKFGDVFDGHAGVTEKFCCASGGENLDFEG